MTAHSDVFLCTLFEYVEFGCLSILVYLLRTSLVTEGYRFGQVWVNIPTMHCSVSDVEYEFMVNTVLENLREHTRIPPQAYAVTLKLFPEAAGMQFTELPLDSRSGSHQLKRLSSSVSRISSVGSRQSISKEKSRDLIDPTLVSMKISVDIKSLQLTLTNEHKVKPW